MTVKMLSGLSNINKLLGEKWKKNENGHTKDPFETKYGWMELFTAGAMLCILK